MSHLLNRARNDQDIKAVRCKPQKSKVVLFCGHKHGEGINETHIEQNHKTATFELGFVPFDLDIWPFMFDFNEVSNKILKIQ